MNKTKILLLMLLLSLSGCANISPFSPKSQQRINNNGKLDEIKSNQNGLIAEVGKLKQDLQMVNSQLKEVQSGLINLSGVLSKNENTGVQILYGDGSLILVFSIFTVGATLWYRGRAIKSEKNLSIITKEVAKYNIAELNDEIIKSAIKEGRQKDIISILSKAIKD